MYIKIEYPEGFKMAMSPEAAMHELVKIVEYDDSIGVDDEYLENRLLKLLNNSQVDGVVSMSFLTGSFMDILPEILGASALYLVGGELIVSNKTCEKIGKKWFGKLLESLKITEISREEYRKLRLLD